MPGRLEILSCSTGLLLLSVTAAPCQSLAGLDVSVRGVAGQPLLSLGSEAPPPSSDLDMAVFLAELGTYITKEVLSDSAEEFPSSPISSRLSREMPKTRSEFGSHCLMIVGRLGSALPSLPGLEVSEASATDEVWRAAGVALAARQIWSAFRNNVENGRSGVSLDPKVSARRVGLYLTLHF